MFPPRECARKSCPWMQAVVALAHSSRSLLCRKYLDQGCLIFAFFCKTSVVRNLAGVAASFMARQVNAAKQQSRSMNNRVQRGSTNRCSSASITFGASNFGLSEKNSRTSRAYSSASSGLTVCKFMVTFFCPVSICPDSFASSSTTASLSWIARSAPLTSYRRSDSICRRSASARIRPISASRADP